MIAEAHRPRDPELFQQLSGVLRLLQVVPRAGEDGNGVHVVPGDDDEIGVRPLHQFDDGVGGEPVRFFRQNAHAEMNVSQLEHAEVLALFFIKGGIPVFVDG